MPLSDVQHVFVLMLENRSYDHILGGLRLAGRDPTGAPTTADGLDPSAVNYDSNGTPYPTAQPAPGRMPEDPPHEYDDVRLQLLGQNGPTDTYDNTTITSSGFVLSYEQVARGNPLGDIMSSFRPGTLPAVSQLAAEFCTCDRWFSSLPGPTVPNRMFLLAGSSRGNPKSPSILDLVRGELGGAIRFVNGTIFKRIKEQTDLRFVVYRGDDFPLCQVFDGVDRSDTKPFDRAGFQQDYDQPNLPEFIFIEPAYGALDSYRSGDSQHPVGDIIKGDNLVRDVYEGIRNSACWPRSMLIITYDEHGGFFDHVPPPSNVPAPGDCPPLYAFNFNQLGVRVPAVVVSPLIPPHTIDHLPYDHTTVLATLRARFPEIGYFTERDRLANTLEHLFTLSPATIRRSPKKLVARPVTPTRTVAAPPSKDDREPAGPGEVAFVQVAAHLERRETKAEPAAIGAALRAIKTKGDARAYLRRVSALLRDPQPRAKKSSLKTGGSSSSNR